MGGPFDFERRVLVFSAIIEISDLLGAEDFCQTNQKNKNQKKKIMFFRESKRNKTVKPFHLTPRSNLPPTFE
jgi:hypothetical protein